MCNSSKSSLSLFMSIHFGLNVAVLSTGKFARILIFLGKEWLSQYLSRKKKTALFLLFNVPQTTVKIRSWRNTIHPITSKCDCLFIIHYFGRDFGEGGGGWGGVTLSKWKWGRAWLSIVNAPLVEHRTRKPRWFMRLVVSWYLIFRAQSIAKVISGRKTTKSQQKYGSEFWTWHSQQRTEAIQES